jgi:hypothetical protein
MPHISDFQGNRGWRNRQSHLGWTDSGAVGRVDVQPRRSVASRPGAGQGRPRPRAVVIHPLGATSPSPLRSASPWPRRIKLLGHRTIPIRGRIPTARSLTHLRIAAHVAADVAAASGWGGRLSPGGTLTRWTTYEVSGSHRLLPSSPTSLAWSHLIPGSPSDPILAPIFGLKTKNEGSGVAGATKFCASASRRQRAPSPKPSQIPRLYAHRC